MNDETRNKKSSPQYLSISISDIGEPSTKKMKKTQKNVNKTANYWSKAFHLSIGGLKTSKNKSIAGKIVNRSLNKPNLRHQIVYRQHNHKTARQYEYNTSKYKRDHIDLIQSSLKPEIDTSGKSIFENINSSTSSKDNYDSFYKKGYSS